MNFFPSFLSFIVVAYFQPEYSVSSNCGVVFTDKYGREPPVLTNTSGTFKLDKSSAIEKRKIEIENASVRKQMELNESAKR